MYGSMIWDLFGDQAGQFYRWNTCVKLCWNVPRSTHTYFIDNLLATEFRTIRQQVMSRYAGFYQSLLNSPSREVVIVSRMVGRNVSTNTGSNLFNIAKETNIDIHNPIKIEDVHFVIHQPGSKYGSVEASTAITVPTDKRRA